MNNLHEKLLVLFPDAVDGDWVLSDPGDGKGQRIEKWNRPEPVPSKGAIESVNAKEATDRFKDRVFSAQFNPKEVMVLKLIAKLHNMTYEQVLTELRGL